MRRLAGKPQYTTETDTNAAVRVRIRSLTGSKSRISVLDKERERLKKKKEVPAFLHFIREGKLSLYSSIERERELECPRQKS